MMKMNKIIFCFLGALFSCSILPLSAQSYVSLKKQIETNRSKDLPQTALRSVDKMINLASRRGDNGELLWALLTRGQLCRDISPDSAATLIPRVEKLLNDGAKPEMQAVCHAVLGMLYAGERANMDENASRKAVNHFMVSLQNPALLASARVKDFLPFMIDGADSRYFNDDLLHVLTRFCSGRLSDINNEVLHTDSLSLSLLGKALREYRQAGNREAEFFLLLDSVDATERIPIFRRSLNNSVRLQNNQVNKLNFYRSLINRFSDLDVCAEAYLRLSTSLNDKRKDSYFWAEEGVRRYPKSKKVNSLRNRLLELTRPELSLSLPQGYAYPGREDSLTITAVHTSRAVVKFYKLDVTTDAEILRRQNQKELKKLAKSVVFQIPIVLPETASYEQVHKKIAFVTPKAGIYLVKLESNGTEASDQEFLYVSRLHVMKLNLPKGGTRVLVSEAVSGRPVEGAQLIVRAIDENSRVVQTLQTDKNGEATISSLRSFCMVYPQTNDDKFCPGLQLGMNNENNFVQGVKQLSMAVYTDRAIYRPGQKVQVGGFLYEQKGDEVHVKAGESVELSLFDATHQKSIDKMDVVSDAFGSVKGEFTLPVSCLNGQFYISCKYATASFRVEEYKRPTFTVSFDDFKEAYSGGDTVLLHGTVKTYAGFPLAQTPVALTTSRSFSPWCYSFYHQNDLDKEVRDTVQTDADGRFSVRVFLNVNKLSEKNGLWWLPRFYVYQTEAVATSANGESEIGSYSLFVGNRPAFLSTTMPQRICKEETATFQINQLNAGGKPVAGKGHYEILQGNVQKASGEWNFNETIKSTLLNELPSGEYVLQVVPAERTDTLVQLKYHFMIFSMADTHPVGKDMLQVYQSGDDFGNGEIRVHLATPEKNAYVHYMVTTSKEELANKVISLSDSAITIPFSYQSQYGDGIEVLFTFVRNGEVYTQAVVIKKHEPDKHLTLRWKTFRDRLRPGQRETWTLQVLRNGNPVKASLLATLYDGSLDKFQKLDWSFSLNFDRDIPFGLWSGVYKRSMFLRFVGSVKFEKEDYWQFSHINGKLFGVDDESDWELHSPHQRMLYSAMNTNMKTLKAPAVAKSRTLMLKDEVPESTNAVAEFATGGGEMSETKLRTDFSETAFFMPALTTDDAGEAAISFVLPQSLTQWNFKALAHTGDMDYGMLDTIAVASKDFMLQPNIPRFLRVGDETFLAASLRNVTEKGVKGTVFMELLDPSTQKAVSRQNVTFSVGAKGETMVSFPIRVTNEYPLLVCRMMASSGEFSDGEQNYIPVLDDRQEITESIPLNLEGQGVKTANLTSLFGNNNPHATHRRLTVEYTGNPAWLAIEALPSLSQPICEDALSMATAYYALSLAQFEAHADPAIEQLARAWQKSGSVDSVYLQMERNADLKQIILSETPWMASALAEKERLGKLVQLFDSVTLSYRLHSYEDKLMELQNSNGSWSWFKGMRGNLGITTDICEIVFKLSRIDPAAMGEELSSRMKRAMKFMDDEIARIVDEMKKNEKKNHQVPYVEGELLRYLYVCALQGYTNNSDRTYLLNLIEKSSTSYNMYSKSLAVNVLTAAGRKKAAEITLQSLLEHTVSRPEMGRYFDTDRALWSWNSYKIPTQVAALDAVCMLMPQDTVTIAEMTRWLLQAKRTQTWGNAKNSVDAIFYLFVRQHLLSQAGGRNFPKITLTLANHAKEDLTADAHEMQMPATLGYFRRTLMENELKAAPVQIAVNKTTTPLTFGAVYAQYLVPSSEVKAAEAGLSLKCTYSVRRGEEWQTVSGNVELQKGDLIRVRYELAADRDYDFVCLKESRPACCEPVDALSGYDWHKGCYQAVGDASTQYFFEQLRKGKHVVETQMRTDRAGHFSSAVPTVQCVYAPEFSGRAEAIKLQVK